MWRHFLLVFPLTCPALLLTVRGGVITVMRRVPHSFGLSARSLLTLLGKYVVEAGLWELKDSCCFKFALCFLLAVQRPERSASRYCSVPSLHPAMDSKPLEPWTQINFFFSKLLPSWHFITVINTSLFTYHLTFSCKVCCIFIAP